MITRVPFFSSYPTAVARCDDEGDGKVYVVVDMNSYMYLSLLVLLFLNFLMAIFDGNDLPHSRKFEKNSFNSSSPKTFVPCHHPPPHPHHLTTTTTSQTNMILQQQDELRDQHLRDSIRNQGAAHARKLKN